ncbi:hypothetical protein H0I23_01545 [Cellulophaga sp. HaHaR_3_176]|uniref:hypothetical protein n=1 Tax=Cellulophaga sp. HaHaR_3_176 TaxID=1942464 RepID=UPI001C1F5953|nr:hypothetical protein [Cellulophaga sp. HaHaR_3_176]QWX84362.1 hypothetical protein H0I23_01545 [Cellulophaga sp. HaHaR_3_176]
MKKIVGQFLFFFCILLLNGCNSSYLNIGANLSSENDKSFNSISESHHYTGDNYIIDSQIDSNKLLFAEITDIEEENEKTSLTSREKASFSNFLTIGTSDELLEHLFFKLHKNILAFKANNFTPSLRRYLVFQNYRI